jgi:hypothetical protein
MEIKFEPHNTWTASATAVLINIENRKQAHHAHIKECENSIVEKAEPGKR